ncbi:AI-2E family transporter [uncultured Nocardioides sp.]|uniref:AI-2E family transporter n=1 Tax=uncultured Nocardioides sp. TaxID=198441 RepID=UPI00262C1366|nr:AI-2E family transporter [uncultured Nocardioides sp.]
MTPDAGARTPDRATVLDRGAGMAQRWGIRLLVLAAVLYVLGWAIGHTWVIWFPVLLATLLATVLAPPVTWMRRKKLPDTLAAVLVMVLGIGLIALLFTFMVPQIIDEAPGIADSATGGLSTIQQWLTEGPLNMSEEQINGYLAAIADQIQSSADVISSGVFAGISSATNAVVNLAIILVLTFLFIKDGHRFLPWVDRVAGRRAGRHLTEVLGRVWRTIGGFIRTQALVSLIDAILIGTGLVVIGVPLAIPLALLTFFGGFIPIVGAIVAGALAVLVTLVTNGPGDALWVLIIILAVQQLEGNVLSPWLQGKIMRLHASIILLSVTAGGTLFGITGAFLAVPVIAAVAEVMRYLDDETTAATAPGAEPGRAPDSGDAAARKEREEKKVGVSDAAVDSDAADPAAADTPARPDRDAPGGKAARS